MYEIDGPGIHCIVLMYDGKPIPDEMQESVMTAIADVIATRGIAIPEMITIVYKDSQGVAGSVARDVLLAKKGVVAAVEEDPVENALSYLSKRYAKEMELADPTILIIRLVGDIRDHKFTIGRNGIGDAVLMEALKTVCTKTVNQSQMKKYGIRKSALEAIRRCYDES